MKYFFVVNQDKTVFSVRNLDGDLKNWVMDLGYLQVCEKYLVSEPILAEELSAALSVIELYIDDLRREVAEFADFDSDVAVIGGGIFNKIAAVELGNGDTADKFEDYVLSSKSVEELFRALATENLENRLSNPGLESGFATHIVGALCIVVETFRQLGITELVVSCEEDIKALVAKPKYEG